MNCLTVTTYLVDAKFATFTPIDSVIDHALDVQYASLISHPPNHGLACIVFGIEFGYMFCVAHGSESKNGFFFTFLSLEDPTNSFIPRVNYGNGYYVRLFALRMLPTVLMESSSLLKTFKCCKQIASLPTVSFFKKRIRILLIPKV